jgi:hypothetical protein
MKSDPTHPGIESPAETPAPLLPQVCVTSETPATTFEQMLTETPDTRTCPCGKPISEYRQWAGLTDCVDCEVGS